MIEAMAHGEDIEGVPVTVELKQVRMDQSSKPRDLKRQSNMAVPKIPQIRWVSI